MTSPCGRAASRIRRLTVMSAQPATSYDAAVAPDPAQLIDRVRYPIDDLADPRTVALADECRRSSTPPAWPSSPDS